MDTARQRRRQEKHKDTQTHVSVSGLLCDLERAMRVITVDGSCVPVPDHTYVFASTQLHVYLCLHLPTHTHTHTHVHIHRHIHIIHIHIPKKRFVHLWFRRVTNNFDTLTSAYPLKVLLLLVCMVMLKLQSRLHKLKICLRLCLLLYSYIEI